MKKTLGIITVLALAASIATNVAAKREKKDAPKRRFAEEVLEKAGGKHFPEKMKVKQIDSIEIGETYYHVFSGELDEGGYHIIIFDNYQNYLGYYKSDYPPTNYEIEGSIVLNPNETDADTGRPVYHEIPIDEKKGLPKKLEIGGIPVSLEESPYSKGKAKGATGETTTGEEGATDEEVADDKPKPEFRVWTINHQGKPRKARAIYVKEESGKVYLRSQAIGTEKGFALYTLSNEDQEYIKQFQ